MNTEIQTQSKDPRFKISHYGLVCGYVQREEKYGKYRELYWEHGHFHVRWGEVGKQYTGWETFSGRELTKARALYGSKHLKSFDTVKRD